MIDQAIVRKILPLSVIFVQNQAPVKRDRRKRRFSVERKKPTVRKESAATSARNLSKRDNLLVNQNDAWRYKVTRQRIRLIINFNTRQHQILRCYFPTFPPSRLSADTGESVSIGIGYRTTNAPFANDNHPLRSPVLCSISHGRHELLSSS